MISIGSKDDIKQLLRALGNIRSLLLVQAGPSEEDLMKNSLKYATLIEQWIKRVIYCCCSIVVML